MGDWDEVPPSCVSVSDFRFVPGSTEALAWNDVYPLHHPKASPSRVVDEFPQGLVVLYASRSVPNVRLALLYFAPPPNRRVSQNETHRGTKKKHTEQIGQAKENRVVDPNHGDIISGETGRLEGFNG